MHNYLHEGDMLFLPHLMAEGDLGGRRQVMHHKLLGDTDSDFKPEAIASLAQDRSEWRKCVVVCSAAE